MLRVGRFSSRKEWLNSLGGRMEKRKAVKETGKAAVADELMVYILKKKTAKTAETAEKRRRSSDSERARGSSVRAAAPLPRCPIAPLRHFAVAAPRRLDAVPPRRRGGQIRVACFSRFR